MTSWANQHFEILPPDQWVVPAVFNSPHSGRRYPQDLLDKSRLSLDQLRRSEDCFVDELFMGCLTAGAPLLRAHAPRVYVDFNREPFELDPRMFFEELPGYMNTGSPRVAGGLGTVPRLVGEGEEIYRGRLPLAEAMARIDGIYRPYHRTLTALLEEAHRSAGQVLLVDCHSMPASAVAGSGKGADIVLGDRFGASCSAHVTGHLERLFAAEGFRVVRNRPYAGGFITSSYGSPMKNRHAIQVEVNRALYLDERNYEKNKYFNGLKEALARVTAALLSTLDAAAGEDRRAAE
jgi:N-formylglutamate amidohydrolase